MSGSSQESKQLKMEIGEPATFKLSEKTLSRGTLEYNIPDDDAEQKNSENTDMSVENCEYTESKEKSSSWSEICRVCANENSHVVPIFEGEGAEHDLCKKIHKYLPIQVSKDDTLPVQLCYQCTATILAWHELLEGCMEAEKRLVRMESELKEKEEMQLKYTEIPSSNGHAGIIIESEELVDDPEPIATHGEEHICSMEKLQEPSETVEHAPSQENEERLSGAKLRDSRTSGFTDFQKAYVSFFGCASNDKTTKTQPDASVDRKDEATEPRESSEVTSEITAVIFDNEKKENGRTVRSNRRNKKFNVTIAVKTSRRRAVNEKCEKAIVAEIPKSRLRTSGKTKKDDTETTISKSKVKRSSSGPYTCDLCGKKFRLRDSLKTHARIHTGEKQYTCHICGKQFAQTGCLYYHLKHVHAGVKNHSCDICGRSFAMKTTMEDHRRSIHTGERPFVCDSCGKTFKTKSSLYIHSRIHTETYPHECKYCKKVFRWRQQLLGHLTIHTGEKNHSCDVCGKAFGVKNHLTRHKRTHSAEKPYACQQCGMSFGQKRYLTTHERLKHR